MTPHSTTVRGRRAAPRRSIVTGLALAVLLLGSASSAHAYSPFGSQRVLVIFMEHAHAAAPNCPADYDFSTTPPSAIPGCPRHTAAAWEPILQSRLDSYVQTESYGQASVRVHVLVDPATADGWWPTPHTVAQYNANGSLWDGANAIGRDAGENIVHQALVARVISLPELFSYTRLLVIDNYHAHQGQANSQGAPMNYSIPLADVPGFSALGALGLSIPWSPTAALDAEGAGDDIGLSIFEHEFGHQLGEPDLYSQSPCPLVDPGVATTTMTGDNSDCVGPWDHMALDYWNTPGLSGYTRMKLGWLAAGSPAVQEVPNFIPGSYSLAPLEQPAGGRPVLLQVPNDFIGRIVARAFGATVQYVGFQAECRRRLGDDANLPDEGLLVTYLDETRGNDHPLYVPRTATQSVLQAILHPGETYENTRLHVSISYVRARADGGCDVNVNRRPLRISDFGVPVASLSNFIRQMSAFGSSRSGHVFAGNGIEIAPTAAKPNLTTAAACPAWAQCGPVQPPHKGASTRIRFLVANLGNEVTRGQRAVVRVSEPYAPPAACGGGPNGKTIATVRPAALKHDGIGFADVPWKPSTDGTFGITVSLAAANDAHPGNNMATSALGFETMTVAAKKPSKPLTAVVRVSASSRCLGPVWVRATALTRPRNWAFTTTGLDTPVSPGAQRPVGLVLQAPAGTAPGTYVIPVALQGGSNLPPNGPVSPAFRGDEQPLIGGIDLVVRVSRPGAAPQPFRLPPPLPLLKPSKRYPSSVALPSATSLKLSCTPGAVLGKGASFTGALGGGPGGATITLSYLSPTGILFTQTTTTDGAGAFTDVFTPGTAGTWKVNAVYAGDGSHLAARASECSFQATVAPVQQPSSVSLKCPSGASLGKQTQVDGSISPTVTGASVTVDWEPPKGSTTTHHLTTDGKGAFSDTLTPNQSGTWKVTASWSGNNQLLGAQQSCKIDVK